MVGPSGLEPPTLRLSVVRSNQLSYGPSSSRTLYHSFPAFAENSLSPSLLLSVPNPLRWASARSPSRGRSFFICFPLPENSFEAFFANFLSRMKVGGDSRDRTGDLLLARQALSQLSYIPSSSSQTSHHSFPSFEEISLVPLLLLFQTNPLRWALFGFLSPGGLHPLN